MPRLLSHPLAFLAAQALAFWPSWRWYGGRLMDGSAGLWCLPALGAAVLACWMPATRRPAATIPVWPAAAAVLLYAAAASALPPIFAAAAAIIACCATLARWRGGALSPGLLGLALLATPCADSLDFYLGFPLRLLVSSIAAPLLRTSGFEASSSGAALLWNGRLVEVDAPCSGVRMLHASLFLLFAISAMRRWRWRRTALGVAGTLALVLAANVLRVSSLFFTEAEVVAAPPWGHEAAGLAAFLIPAAFAMAAAWRPHRSLS